MKRYITAIIAVVIATGMAAFTRPVHSTVRHSDLTEYYFEFTGVHGDEATPSEWQELSHAGYDSLTCTLGTKGCRIITTSVSNPSAPLGQREISAVPVNGNDTPISSSDNIEIKNKN